MNYSCLSKQELEEFTEMFSVFHDLILAMIRNAVHVLPKDKTNNSKPSLTAHLQVNSATKHNQEYEKFIDIKDVFLSCFGGENRRDTLQNGIKKFVLKPKPENKKDYKVKICISTAFFQQLDDISKDNFSKDIRVLENIINKINDSFNQLLPSAQQKGQLLIQQIRRVEIPTKAKYTGKKQEKGKGIA